MLRFSEQENFEAAARCRDTLRALGALREKQKVVASPDTEQDVVALYSDDFCSASRFSASAPECCTTARTFCSAPTAFWSPRI